jgi:uncharacterized membrane protein
MKKIIALLALAFSLTAFAGSDFTCAGTEPFWHIDLVGKSLAFNYDYDEVYGSEAVVSRTTDGVDLVVRTKSATAKITKGECNDGMSDQTFTHEIIYTDGKTVVSGCCNQITKK